MKYFHFENKEMYAIIDFIAVSVQTIFYFEYWFRVKECMWKLFLIV